MAKTIVGLFDSAPNAQSAVGDLVQMGIARDEIGVVAYRSDDWRAGDNAPMVSDTAAEDTLTGAGVGAAIGGISGLVMGLVVLPIPGIGPVLAAGPIVAALAGMGFGAAAGGLIGALTSVGVPEEHAQHYAEAVRRGGTLVTVHATDDQARHVSVVMARWGAADIQARADQWRARGWQGYDPHARAFTPDEVTRERDTYRSLDADGGRVIIPVVERRSHEPPPPSGR